jgi:hypothetical protein
MDLVSMTRLLSAVCPIDGVSADGTIWFSPGATDQQKAAAQTAYTANINGLDVPASVHMWQAKAALQAAGKLDAANTAVSGSNNQAIIMAWEWAPEVSRDSPSVAAIGQAVGLQSADIDQLFIAAAAITV